MLEFLRKKDYELKEELGQGACGQTVLLYDSQIDEYFVCKKYSPFSDDYREELFKNFIEEIKILHKLYHKNVVRVFNYYLYPEHFSGYILMEYIIGSDIEAYLKQYPENINEVFIQTINGFTYLEETNILHRDIRPYNILITTDNIVKIIDFGFGKKIDTSHDFDKSISLNWWCEPPLEFDEKKYNFSTEVYFIGKLFEKIISEYDIEIFNYRSVLNSMCKKDMAERTSSFSEVNKIILNNQFSEIEFEDIEVEYYRNFSDSLFNLISKIDNGTKYINDIQKIEKNLEDIYRNSMLEIYIPKPERVVECFLSGVFYYHKRNDFEVNELKNFINILRACSIEKKKIILSNIQTKLDSITRYTKEEPDEDDLPF
jgi:eukaryotic-like serine/threonine-protein kinase